MNNDKLADLLIPDIDNTPDYYLNMYPKRNLKPDTIVTRYAPSPTGFQHIGSVFAALISERLAHQSNGIFYLRVEDTDKKREVKGSIEDTIDTFRSLNIEFDEGMIDSENEKGSYGPYKQSKRSKIYRSFAKDLIKKGLAYPCFCTEEELAAIRKEQEALKINTGYYGKWAVDRNIDFNTIERNIALEKPYVIRLKSHGNPDNRIICSDLIRGEISFPENHQDIVILKSDGIPTYHFAHAVDDYLMGTTHVIRGEEWLSSLPIHLQLFQVLGFKAPKYAHIPNVMKLDGSSKRKLSKRKDPESSISYYRSEGYPSISVIEYLVNLINSDFEQWRFDNPALPYTTFKIELSKMSQSGALFDILKLSDISKNIIAAINYETVYELYLAWCKQYDNTMADLLVKYPVYSKQILNIDRETPKPRKDIAKWLDVKEFISYFYDELFHKDILEKLPANIDYTEAKILLNDYKAIYNHNDSKDQWFEKLKSFAEEKGYAKDAKSYKKMPEMYKGKVADIASVIRLAISGRTNTPDLYEIMQVMGEERVLLRINL